MERILPLKTIALSANATVTLSWDANDFLRVLPESIIKQTVAIRLTCSTTATNAVYVGVRYQTLDKTYQLAERQTIGYIPPAGSVELTPASVPAMAKLFPYITIIYVDLTSPVTGNVSISLIIDDKPPPLTGIMPFAGLDQKFESTYTQIALNNSASITASTLAQVMLTYTVPTPKRAYIDLVTMTLVPTPTWPGLLQAFLIISGVSYYTLYSSKTEPKELALSGLQYVLAAGDQIQIRLTNIDTTAYAVDLNYFSILGREVF